MFLPPTAQKLFDNLKEIARSKVRRIVFPEGHDPRVIAAAQTLSEEGLVEPILLKEAVVDPMLATLYYERRRAKGITLADAENIAAQPLYRAALMVAAGQADGVRGGRREYDG